MKEFYAAIANDLDTPRALALVWELVKDSSVSPATKRASLLMADKILALGTGNFAKLYSDKMTQVVIQVAQAEPGVGTVQEIGIERWNPDDSANVLAVANMTTTMPDGKKIGEIVHITVPMGTIRYKVLEISFGE